MGTVREQILIASTLSSGTIRELLGSPNTGTGGGIGADDATDYMEQAVIELLFMNEDLVGLGDQNGLKGSDIEGNLYIALLTGDPGESGDQNVEAAYDGYTRVPIVRGLSGWEYKDEGAKNIPVATWQPNDDPLVTVTHFAIMDSLIDGNMLFKKELPSPVDINTGDQAQFNYNQLAVKMN
ncbi:MAG: hypothetical protein DRI97_07295 [Bacteroidetes bacterium]|nr:MAG: hypothetical protein DRI97_07295 [Bacteroidota bacterium]